MSSHENPESSSSACKLNETSSVGAEVGTPVGAEVGIPVGTGVGTPVGAESGTAVGAGGGTAVGAGSGTAVGDSVGSAVGDGSGMGVGVDVGAVVGREEGTALGGCDAVGVVVGWSKTSPPATQKWSEYGVARSWKWPPTCAQAVYRTCQMSASAHVVQ